MKGRTLDEIVLEELSTPEDQKMYLEVAMEEYIETGDEIPLLLAIRQVVKAGMGFASLANKTGLSIEVLNQTLSGKINPELKTIQLILSELGYSFTTLHKDACLKNMKK